jgi:hypothetical protein
VSERLAWCTTPTSRLVPTSVDPPCAPGNFKLRKACEFEVHSVDDLEKNRLDLYGFCWDTRKWSSYTWYPYFCCFSYHSRKKR